MVSIYPGCNSIHIVFTKDTTMQNLYHYGLEKPRPLGHACPAMRESGLFGSDVGLGVKNHKFQAANRKQIQIVTLLNPSLCEGPP